MSDGDSTYIRRLEIRVDCAEDRYLHCCHCKNLLLVRDVAFYTRLRQDEAFEAWCHECAHQMVSWAMVGARSALGTEATAAAVQIAEDIVHGR